MANINVRVDENTKIQAEKIVDALGLNMSSAINIYLKQIVLTNSIPFEIKLTPNAETMVAIEEGKKIAHDEKIESFKDISSLRKSLGV